MDFDSLNEIPHGEAVRKRLAKLRAHDCFRNTKLEAFHSKNPFRLAPNSFGKGYSPPADGAFINIYENFL